MTEQEYIDYFRSCVNESHPIFTPMIELRRAYTAMCVTLGSSDHSNDKIAEGLRKATVAYKLIKEELLK